MMDPRSYVLSGPSSLPRVLLISGDKAPESYSLLGIVRG
jgi:hypothetical protein